jgi:REP element-mobilizing transposase RayT
MNGENNKRNRHSIRLKGYDYSEEGAYFVTIVAFNREMFFGKVVEGEMVLNDFGEIAKGEWLKTGEIRHNIEINEDEFCVMPNHFHGIIVISEDNGRDTARRVPTKFGKPVSNSLSIVIGAFKSAVTKRINQERNTPGVSVWQSRFYDHIIRDEKDYDNIVNYIYMNPSNWETDEEYC